MLAVVTLSLLSNISSVFEQLASIFLMICSLATSFLSLSHTEAKYQSAQHATGPLCAFSWPFFIS